MSRPGPKANLTLGQVGLAWSDTVETLPMTPPAGRKQALNSSAPVLAGSGSKSLGGYERGVTRHLQRAGFTVIVMQPVQVKAFAKLRFLPLTWKTA